MTETFTDSTRLQTSLLSGVEKRALNWLAARVPERINSDHLTLLGFVSLALAGVCYGLSGFNPNWLHAVNACILLNWLGDSLDGTLARYRNRLRPRYGFYVDHVVDTSGTFLLVLGMGLSPYMSLPVAAAILIAYFMLSINSYLATYVLGSFRISFGMFSPTELRLLLGIGNLVLLFHPRVHILGPEFLLFDIGGCVAALAMLAVYVKSTVSNTRKLYHLEPPAVRRSA